MLTPLPPHSGSSEYVHAAMPMIPRLTDLEESILRRGPSHQDFNVCPVVSPWIKSIWITKASDSAENSLIVIQLKPQPYEEQVYEMIREDLSRVSGVDLRLARLENQAFIIFYDRELSSDKLGEILCRDNIGAKRTSDGLDLLPTYPLTERDYTQQLQNLASAR